MSDDTHLRAGPCAKKTERVAAAVRRSNNSSNFGVRALSFLFLEMIRLSETPKDWWAWAESGNNQEIQRSLQRGVLPDSVQTHNHIPAVVLAIRNDRLETAQLLLKHGAKHQGPMFVAQAARSGAVRCFRHFIKSEETKEKLGEWKFRKQNMLQLALAKSETSPHINEICRELMKRGVNAFEKKTLRGESVFEYVLKKSSALLPTFLRHSGWADSEEGKVQLVRAIAWLVRERKWRQLVLIFQESGLHPAFYLESGESILNLASKHSAPKDVLTFFSEEPGWSVVRARQ